MLYQLSYSRGDDLVARNYAKEPDKQPIGEGGSTPGLGGAYAPTTMPTPFLTPTMRRLVGTLLMLSGGLMGVGLLLKVYVGVYNWNTVGYQNPTALMLSVNLVGLLACGFLMRMGLRMRRGDTARRDPNADEIL
ncbi:hypothetical protein GCM10027511_24290 [Hymenobacter humi]